LNETGIGLVERASSGEKKLVSRPPAAKGRRWLLRPLFVSGVRREAG